MRLENIIGEVDDRLKDDTLTGWGEKFDWDNYFIIGIYPYVFTCLKCDYKMHDSDIEDYEKCPKCGRKFIRHIDGKLREEYKDKKVRGSE